MIAYAGAPRPLAFTAAAVAEAHTKLAHHSRSADRTATTHRVPAEGPLHD